MNAEPTVQLFGIEVTQKNAFQKHSLLKSDPKSNLAMLKPKNEESEKEKFRTYWDNQAKGKLYNPRF
jgi:hypothetical protein